MICLALDRSPWNTGGLAHQGVRNGPGLCDRPGLQDATEEPSAPDTGVSSPDLTRVAPWETLRG